MKIRLSWKLFGVMMFNVVLIVGVMVVIMKLLVSREFQGYIRAIDLERFQNVKEGLQQYYSFYGSWEVLASSRGRWGRICTNNPHCRASAGNAICSSVFLIQIKSTGFVQIPPLSHLGQAKENLLLRWCFRDKIFLCCGWWFSMKKVA